jgi:hypothetical protein
MEIQSTVASRVAWRVGGTIMTVTFTALPLIGYLDQGHDPLFFMGFLPAAVGLLMIFGLGRSAWIKAGETSISYVPAVGSAKVFPRSEVKSIARDPGVRGLPRLEFRGQDNRLIVSCEESFARIDVEKLSAFLGVTLIWDSILAAQPSNAGSRPSWDEIKSQLDPEQLAEIEKHMKKPGIG